KKYGMRGVAIGGNVAGEEISDPKFNPFWAKAEQLGALVFIHPQGDGAPAQLQQRFKGNGYLGNVIGNPLETTIALSHLIFEGTLDRFPGLKICAAHAGGTAGHRHVAPRSWQLNSACGRPAQRRSASSDSTSRAMLSISRLRSS